ncbi:POU domain, class 4, transcription factor 3 isoform X2 [Dermacentor andersoni]|uniref:abnormal chemosensory protein 6 n=1 Tax=Dermacentor variabilis TaxID=34621 RepID=UPI0021556215|nr:POU domain, class 4, transcription factor 3-like isoform X2 [Dermacentor andersoni]
MAAIMNGGKQPASMPLPPHLGSAAAGSCFSGRYSPTYRAAPPDPMRARHCAMAANAAAAPGQKSNGEFMVKTETDSWTSRKLQLMDDAMPEAEAHNRRWRCLAAAPRFHYADMSSGPEDPDNRYRMQNLGNFFPGLEEAGLMGRAEALVDISKHSPPTGAAAGLPIRHDMMYHAMGPPGGPGAPGAPPTSRPGPPHHQMGHHPSTMDGMDLLDPLCPSSLPGPLGAMQGPPSTDGVGHQLPPLYGMHAGGAGGGFPGSAVHDADSDPRELEAFAERFKQRRIKLGVTQADVGRALANLKLPGVGSLSQSTICRFESLTLSHNNMVALKPILGAWLEAAEAQAKNKRTDPDLPGVLPAGEKKRKRTSIAAPEKRSLEAYFAVQPRPSGEKIAAIAEKLDLKKNVVRVWFCNQRQKQKRMKYSAVQH